MSLESLIGRLVRRPSKNTQLVSAERRQLRAIASRSCNATALRTAGSIQKEAFLNAADQTKAWTSAETLLAKFSIPDGTGGVNPGDRRAIFHLMHYLRPSSVLEIGTHIGASTLHIATALSLIAEATGDAGHLTTVDLKDVNDEETMPWREYGAPASPAVMLGDLQLQDFVNFETRPSLDFLNDSREKYDVIFLDGDHSASTVYQEVPAALERLSPGGVILLHDYFPDLKPLWSNGSLIPGPYLALDRLRREGSELTVLPLGELPWPTKLGSHTTSLALLLKAGESGTSDH